MYNKLTIAQKKQLVCDFHAQSKLNMKEFAQKHGVAYRSMSRMITDFRDGKFTTIRYYPSPISPPKANEIPVFNEPAVSEKTIEMFASSSMITIFNGSDSYAVSKLSDPDFYSEVMQLWGQDKHLEAWETCRDCNHAIKNLKINNVQVIGTKILFAGYDISDVSLGKDILKAARRGDTDLITGMLAFASKVLRTQQDMSLVNNIFNMFNSDGIKITKGGDLIMFRGVNHDYWDRYTGKTYLSTPGSILVNPKPLITSTGASGGAIHVSGYSFAKNWGQRVVKVLIDPRDVVSFDGGNNKLRVSYCEILCDCN
jgi:hypothetical protein